MMKAILPGICAIALSAGIALAAVAENTEAYGLLFKNGTLDRIDQETALVYRREVTNKLKPEADERDTGEVTLSYREDDETMVKLQFRQDGRHRGLGNFPASVGNPMIMYFYESVIRDMAEAAGGSPFYIRNRVKEALVQPAEIEAGTAEIEGRSVATQIVRLTPFAEDPNRERMQGFGDLVLSVTMSEDVPGWYLSLVAETDGTNEAVYRSELRFDHVEATE